MTEIFVNPKKILGSIKKVNGVGQPPIIGAADSSLFHYLTDAHIPYARLHDVGGTFGGARFVDISNVFPSFDADERDPASYSFAFTDWLMAELDHAGVEPVYRLGETIENFARTYASPRIHPPRDFAKWARICEHVIRHYTEGWGNGFQYRIEQFLSVSCCGTHLIEESIRHIGDRHEPHEPVQQVLQILQVAVCQFARHSADPGLQCAEIGDSQNRDIVSAHTDQLEITHLHLA